MAKDNSLSAAILAGGRARRMGGVNKGTLGVGSVAIIDRQLDALADLSQDIFIVGREDPAWTSRGLRVVHDQIPDAGPLGGIYTALLSARFDRTLVIACDMPFLTGAFLERLVSIDDADVVIPKSARGLEPLCAVYSKRCLGDIRARLNRGAYEASVVPEGVRAVELDVQNDRMFVNVNTPHDYERAKGLIEWTSESRENRITTPPMTGPGDGH